MNLPQKKFFTKEHEKTSSYNFEVGNNNIKQKQETTDLDKISKHESLKFNESINQEKSSNLKLDSLKLQSTNQVINNQLKKSVVFKKIEAILEDDLDELYFKMDETHRRIFKEEGEKTAYQIERVITIGKAVTFKILELIKQWLSLIPGMNKFFIIQEAKIKTDKIIKTLKH